MLLKKLGIIYNFRTKTKYMVLMMRKKHDGGTEGVQRIP